MCGTLKLCLGVALQYLAVLDLRMEQTGGFYVRFMEDWVVLARTRWQLRRAVKLVYADTLRVESRTSLRQDVCRPRVAGVHLLRIHHHLCGHRGNRSADA